jgi:hypothetical protein
MLLLHCSLTSLRLFSNNHGEKLRCVLFSIKQKAIIGGAASILKNGHKLNGCAVAHASVERAIMLAAGRPSSVTTCNYKILHPINANFCKID